MLLDDNVAQLHFQSSRTAAEVDEQLSLLKACVGTILLSLYVGKLHQILTCI